MPELPEVETVVRDIRPLLVKRTITAVEVSDKALRRPWNAEWNERLIGRRIQDVTRRGKWIRVVLDGDMHLLFHLGMSGQMRVVPRKEARQDHTHLLITLGRGGQQLRFRDIRRFGSATLFSTGDEVEAFFAQSQLGPEPFALDLKDFRKKLAGTRRNLKAILLDQRVIAGVGNIYADEALFQARLHPSVSGCDMTARQARRLRDAIETVLRRAIDFRGSSIRDYVGGTGLEGQYQEEFTVYGRTNKPCRRCQTEIQRLRLAGRSTHVCPKCQQKG